MKSERFTQSLRSTLYTDAGLKAMPFPAHIFRSQSDAEWSDIHLNLDECVGAAQAPGVLYCDVLSIDRVVTIARPTLVIARRIEIAPGAAILVSNAGTDRGELRLVVQELHHTQAPGRPGLTVTLLDADMNEQTVQWLASGQAADGLCAGRDGVSPLSARAIEPGLMYMGSALHFHLQAVGTLAILLSDDYPQLAIAQWNWVAELARHHPATAMLAGQATAALLTLGAAQSDQAGMLPVPPLDHQIYAGSATALKDLLLVRQQAWDRLQDRLDSDQHQLEALQLAFDDRQEQVTLSRNLELQASQARTELYLASGQAGSQLRQARLQLDGCARRFALGIRQWQEDKILDAVLDLVIEGAKLLFTVTSTLAGMPVGVPKTPAAGSAPANPAANGSTGSPPASPDTGSSGHGSDTQTPWLNLISDSDDDSGSSSSSDSGSDTDSDSGSASGSGNAVPKPGRSGASPEAVALLAEKAADAIDAISGIAKAALAIYNITQMAEKMQGLSDKIYQQTDAQVDAELATTSLSGLGIVTGGAHAWAALENSIEHWFACIGAQALSQIDGGAEYRLEFRQMLVAARSLCQARLAVAGANAQCIELALRRRSAEAMAAHLRQHAQSGVKALDLRKALLPGAFARLLDAKRCTWLALESYRRACAYFALVPLADLPPLPKLTGDADAFFLHIARICGKELSLKALHTAPQSMRDIAIVLDDAGTLAKLRAQGRIQLVLAPDHPAFQGYARVRMGRIRVFLDGLDGSAELRVRIASSGVYRDKTAEGGEPGFIAPPVQKYFQYGAGTQAVHYDGDIAPRYRDDFFMPTPFTGWDFQFSQQSGEPLKLDSVKALRLVFSGEASSIADGA